MTSARTTFGSWPRAARWATYAAILVSLMLVAAAAGALVVVRRSFPQTAGTIELSGLGAKVRVVRDDWGIPQVYADTSADLFYAQGYVQAQDRFWQMDAWRHITAGRLSELLGKDALDVDKFTRTMGWRRVAERELELLDRRTVANLEAFSRGVTEYLRTHSQNELSLEYALLGTQGLHYEPEDWTPVDSLAWLKAMAWDLHGNSVDELERASLAARFSPEQIADLYPPYPYEQHRPILDEGRLVGSTWKAGAGSDLAGRPGVEAAVDRTRAAMESLPQLVGRGDGVGSNSWVVDGAHSTTGAPILANDPHLAPSVPGIWYQMGLHCNEISRACPYDVAGFTFAGVPGVVIGHNADIAWGFTNLEADVADLYLEQIEGQSYLYDGKQVPLVEHDETIKILGDDPFTYTVRETRHGPLMSDVEADWSRAGANAPAPGGSPERGNGYAVSIRWTGLIPDKTMDAVFELDTAHDFDSFRAAVRDFAAPSQNIVYADRAGHIGYQANGLVPIRKPGVSGDYPVPGWLPRYEWTGDFVPFDALPYVLDPKDGFVASANQAVVGPGYGYYLGDSWDYGYRSQRIADRLTAKAKLSPEDMTRIQLDDRNGFAPVLVEHLLSIDMGRGFDAIGQRLLRRWSFHQPPGSAPAAYFNAVWRQLLRLTFHDDLPEAFWPDYGSRWYAVVTSLLEQPNSSWWDDRDTDDVVETCDDILRQAMLDGRDEMIRLQDRHPAKWRWGNEHRLELENQTLGSGDSGIANALVNRGGFEVGGGDSIIDATAWNAKEGYAVVWAPSMRMVVSLGDLDQSRWINLTGASGHAFSDHYTDQTKLWADGRTLPFLFTKEAFDQQPGRVLNLVPGQAD